MTRSWRHDPDQLSLWPTEAPVRLPRPPLPRPSSPNTLFFSVSVPQPAAGKARQFALDFGAAHGLTGTARPMENLHVTTNGVGNYDVPPSEVVDACKRAAAGVHIAPFEVVLDRVQKFKGRAGVLLCRKGANEFNLLRNLLDERLFAVGFKRDRARYTPHVTIRYDRQSFPETVLDEPICWTVGKLFLIHSIYGQSLHEPIGDWDLAA